MEKKFVLFSFAVVLMGAPLEAHAQDKSVESLVEQGIKQYNDLEYEGSINTLSTALIMSGATEKQKVLIYQYLGLNYLVLGREAEAEGALRNLLAVDENRELDPVSTPPKVIDFFKKVKEKWIADGKPGSSKVVTVLEQPIKAFYKLPDNGKKNQELNLKVEVENPKKVPLKVLVHFRKSTSDEFDKVEAAPGGAAEGKDSYMASIPSDAVQPPFVEYYLEVIDAKGAVLSSKGDAGIPLRVPVQDDNKKKKKALLWGLVGGASAIAIVLSIALPLALRDGGKDEPPPQKAAVSIAVCVEGTPGC